jgi:hypothetical protein
MKGQFKIWLGRIIVSGVLVVLAGGGYPLNGTASANSSPKLGMITGKVLECAPGLVIVTPGTPVPTAIPEKVVRVHRGITYESESIAFPKMPPWIGSFNFKVPPGKYEVISSYAGPVRWVSVSSGGRYDVKFGIFACPE